MATVLEQLACEVPSESAPMATFKAPFRAILGFSAHESVFFYCWVAVIAIYLILYFAVPLSILNSSNGFKSGSVVLVWTLIIFSVVLMAYVIWNRSTACESKRTKALYYLRGQRASVPRGFSAAIDHAIDDSLKKNSGLKPVPWVPLSPTAIKPSKLPY